MYITQLLVDTAAYGKVYKTFTRRFLPRLDIWLFFCSNPATE